MLTIIAYQQRNSEQNRSKYIEGCNDSKDVVR